MQSVHLTRGLREDDLFFFIKYSSMNACMIDYNQQCVFPFCQSFYYSSQFEKKFFFRSTMDDSLSCFLFIRVMLLSRHVIIFGSKEIF